MNLTLRNPHSVLAVLASRPADVLEVRVPGPKPHGAWHDVAEQATRFGIAITQAAPRNEGRRTPKRGSDPEAARTASAEAVVRERPEAPLEQLFAAAKEEPAPNAAAPLWIALDQVQDPHNVGAIFRSAAFFGVKGILFTRDRAAPLTAVVYDVACGGVEAVPFASRANLSQMLEAAKEAGVWILGSSEHAERDVAEIARDRPWLLVLGNEERGLRHLTLKTCDEVCRLTPRGAVTSLNVSAAAAILIAVMTTPRRQ